MFGIAGFFKYTTIGLGIALGALFIIYQLRVGGLKSEVLEMQLELRTSEMNYSTIKSSLKEQVSIIDAMKIEMDVKDSEIQKWKEQPPEVRYNVIYKNLPVDINLTKDTCETTSDVISSLRGVTL